MSLDENYPVLLHRTMPGPARVLRTELLLGGLPNSTMGRMISCLAIAGYRSLRDVRIALGRLSVVTGPNGSGKSSLYRALKLLADVAQGQIIQSLAAEGGLPSTLWAGPDTISRAMKRSEAPVQGTVRHNAVSLKLGFSSEDFGFAIDLGLPVHPTSSLFGLDPVIKVEAQWAGPKFSRASAFALRKGPLVQIRGEGGEWRVTAQTLASFDSMMTHCADPRGAPELLLLREQMRGWRFYDHFRTDREAASRRPQIGTYTPVLANDGNDLAAALQTVREIGEAERLDAAVADAFPGASIEISTADGYFEISMRQHGLLRALKASELSDGTLRYLQLVAALLSPRPPSLMILNEPEASLHPDLLPPLGRLIGTAAQRSQIMVVTHATPLVRALEKNNQTVRILIEKQLGETGLSDHPSPSWAWPPR